MRSSPVAASARPSDSAPKATTCTSPVNGSVTARPVTRPKCPPTAIRRKRRKSQVASLPVPDAGTRALLLAACLVLTAGKFLGATAGWTRSSDTLWYDRAYKPLLG